MDSILTRIVRVCRVALLCSAAMPAVARAQHATTLPERHAAPTTMPVQPVLLSGESPAATRHARGGGRLRLVFGDSADHTRHNAINTAVLAGGLFTVLWILPPDLPRFLTPDPTLKQWKQAYTKPPVLDDGDWWAWNWIGHPFVGTHEYLMERNWGASPQRAFLFATAASLIWEYGLEAAFERPSLGDMLLTSPVGLVLGEGIHRLTQRLRREGFTATEKVVVVVLNPFYALQHGFR